MDKDDFKISADAIFYAVQNMKYHEWSRIAHVIEQKYKSLSARTVMTDSESESAKKLLFSELGI